MGKHYCILFLPATPLSPYWTLEGLFEPTWRPSRAINLPRVLVMELKRCKDTARQMCRLGAEGPKQLTHTDCDCAMKMHFFTPILDSEKTTE